jgi:hypothetical protein
MTAKARRMAAEFQDHFREAMREAELESVKEEVANLHQDLSAATSGVHSEFNSIGAQMPSATQPSIEPAAETPKVETTASPPSPDRADAGKAVSLGADVARPDLTAAAASPRAETNPEKVAVTEPATPSPVEEPVRKKRARTKRKSDAPAEAGAGASVKAPRPRTRRRAAKTLPSGDDRAA